VRNRIDAVYEDLGEQEVKNVSAPVRVYKIVTGAADSMPAPSVDIANQEIRFCATPDGVQIAYSVRGRGPAVIIVGNWLTHLELDMKSALRRTLIERLARDHQVIRYDARGNGLSDWEVEDISFEASVGDLETMINELGLDRVDLVGQSQGAAISAAYAARHPDKVTHLVLYAGYARGHRARNSESEIAESDALVTLIREGWGKDLDTYVRMFGAFFMPDANAKQLSGFTELQRKATPPENAARIQLALDSIDITGELSNITAPTLVLHCREDARAPFDEGRKLAAGIAGARFVPLDSRNHSMLDGEPALSRYVDEVGEFLKS
jgi:pimeloyl-ACP methyl ester carboxylesterase